MNFARYTINLRLRLIVNFEGKLRLLLVGLKVRGDSFLIPHNKPKSKNVAPHKSYKQFHQKV